MAPAMHKSANPFEHLVRDLPGFDGKYFSLKALGDQRIERFPYSIRVLLESSLRNCDEFEVTSKDVEKILNWESGEKGVEIAFKPSRVLMQDFTGVPGIVDLAAMRDAIARLGGDPKRINPLVPVDLVIDHSVQVDFSRTPDALEKNEALEFERNGERFAFLKWGAQAFDNLLIVPPGSGIVHQVNLEYLAPVVCTSSRTGDRLIYPDSVVGTDSHTTMVNGLGVVAWGVGGIEAEAVMLGQPISMVLPEVVGFKLTGQLRSHVTATDLVLTAVRMLRDKGVVGRFVEFYGPGCEKLSLADRATIANMGPEYGATVGYFPVDAQTLAYLRQSGRDEKHIALVEAYLKAQGLLREYGPNASPDPTFSSILELDLATVNSSIAGPKRPHDHVLVHQAKEEFLACLSRPNGFNGFGVKSGNTDTKVPFTFKGQQFSLTHGSVVIAAITSCTNTSNPSVMLGAGLIARNAVTKGLSMRPYIKTSLSPGSGVVQKYLECSGLIKYLEQLGFFTAGLGCMTCIGNSGDLDEEVSSAINAGDLVAAAVLSGNRNFEGRVHPQTRANYLASPPLVVAYALAGTMAIDFETEPLGTAADGTPVFLRDIWPTSEEINTVERDFVAPALFREAYAGIRTGGSARWKALQVPEGTLCQWDPKSTYIHNPPFFKTMGLEPPAISNITDAFCLLYLGDSVTTDHISPAGRITKNSPAGAYLLERGVDPKFFNSYGSRRGNDEIMARGTFANIRLINKLASAIGPLTTHCPTGNEMSPFEAAELYQKASHPCIILAGKEYGSGSSRDWAAKGPFLLGVKCVIAQSFERIHRSNLVGMGVLPLEFLPSQNGETLGLTGKERFSINLVDQGLKVRQRITVGFCTADGKSGSFEAQSRIDTEVEIEYFRHGGILNYVLRKILRGAA